MKNIILSTAVLALAGTLSVASAKNTATKDSLGFKSATAAVSDTAAFALRDTAAFAIHDTAAFRDTATMDTAAFRDTATMDTAAFAIHDTAAFHSDTATMDTATLRNFRDTAAFNHDTAAMDTATFRNFRDTAAFRHDTALFKSDTTQFMTPNDTALTRDTVLFATAKYGTKYGNDSTQKTPVTVQQLPESVKSTLNSNEFKGWVPSAAFMVKTDTAAYYEVAVTRGTEEKNVNIDERGAVVR